MQTEAEREAADPAGLGFAPDAPGAASGSEPGGQYDPQRAADTLAAPFVRPQVDLGTRGRPGLVKMPRWSAGGRAPPDHGARDATPGVYVPSRHATVRPLSAPSAYRRSAPLLRGGRKRKRPRRASRPQGLDRAGGALADKGP